MKTLKVTIPIAEDENVSGVIAVPAGFKKGSLEKMVAWLNTKLTNEGRRP